MKFPDAAETMRRDPVERNHALIRELRRLEPECPVSIEDISRADAAALARRIDRALKQ